MRVEFLARNAEVSSRLREHADPRLEALEGLYERIQDVRVTVSAQKGWKTVEITLDADGVLLRSEERSNDELASFDKALDRLERQLRRYRERVRSHPRTPEREALLAQPVGDDDAAADAEDSDDIEIGEIRIRRTKSHPVKPMTPEEAALQMELLGHDFFMFYNPQSSQIELVYRRRDGGYGWIEPVLG
jgi:putative sigma-54 modulation protein